MESLQQEDPLNDPNISEQERKRLMRARKFGIDLATVQETIEQ